MSIPDSADDEASWRDAAVRAADITSESDLARSTRACLTVIAIGLTMAVVAVVVFFWAPAAIDTLATSIVMTALLIVLFVIGA